MAIRDGQEFPLPRREPGGLGTALTLGAVPIAARIIAEFLVATVVALALVAAEGRSATRGNRGEGTALCDRRHGTIAGEVSVAIVLDDIRQFEARVRHGCASPDAGSGNRSRGLGMM